MDESRKVLEERTTGHRTISGTEWPIVDQLVRDQRPGQSATWQVVSGLCNGVPTGCEEFVTEWEARRFYEDRTDPRD